MFYSNLFRHVVVVTLLHCYSVTLLHCYIVTCYIPACLWCLPSNLRILQQCRWTKNCVAKMCKWRVCWEYWKKKTVFYGLCLFGSIFVCQVAHFLVVLFLRMRSWIISRSCRSFQLQLARRQMWRGFLPRWGSLMLVLKGNGTRQCQAYQKQLVFVGLPHGSQVLIINIAQSTGMLCWLLSWPRLCICH